MLPCTWPSEQTSNRILALRGEDCSQGAACNHRCGTAKHIQPTFATLVWMSDFGARFQSGEAPHPSTHPSRPPTCRMFYQASPPATHTGNQSEQDTHTHSPACHVTSHHPHPTTSFTFLARPNPNCRFMPLKSATHEGKGKNTGKGRGRGKGRSGKNKEGAYCMEEDFSRSRLRFAGEVDAD